jgi:SAM-dependent MidA family methyltransferase
MRGRGNGSNGASGFRTAGLCGNVFRPPVRTTARYVLELGTAARDWWGEAAAVLRRGRLVAIDYGGTAGELFIPERSGGTLRAYRDHRLVADVLADPGEQDITAHVNFSDLIRAGELAGLKTDDLVTQAQFLTRIAKNIWAGVPSPPPGDLRQFQTLTHPEQLGQSFRVLVQSRPG